VNKNLITNLLSNSVLASKYTQIIFGSCYGSNRNSVILQNGLDFYLDSVSPRFGFRVLC
jgi:hypothetical protein